MRRGCLSGKLVDDDDSSLLVQQPDDGDDHRAHRKQYIVFPLSLQFPSSRVLQSLSVDAAVKMMMFKDRNELAAYVNEKGLEWTLTPGGAG